MNSLILTRSYIKIKPFEINQEFQEFEFEFEQKLNRFYKRWKYFSSWREVECLIKNYLAINLTKLVLLTEEDLSINFQKFAKLIKVPFIMIADF